MLKAESVTQFGPLQAENHRVFVIVTAVSRCVGRGCMGRFRCHETLKSESIEVDVSVADER